MGTHRRAATTDRPLVKRLGTPITALLLTGSLFSILTAGLETEAKSERPAIMKKDDAVSIAHKAECGDVRAGATTPPPSRTTTARCVTPDGIRLSVSRYTDIGYMEQTLDSFYDRSKRASSAVIGNLWIIAFDGSPSETTVKKESTHLREILREGKLVSSG